MPNYQYSLVRMGDDTNLTVFLPGRSPLTAHSSASNFEKIVAEVIAGVIEEDELVRLFDASIVVGERFEAIGERVTVAGGSIYLDGDRVDNALTNHVLRFLDEGVDDWIPLVNFFERVQANPSEHSREQLYEWLSRRDFTITEDGYIVAYKGVNTDEEGDAYSIHGGYAIVDGEVINGRVPNRIGSTVEIPRSMVEFDPAVGCAAGLHVGTFDYASAWGSTLLEVYVDPRDVVSVPTDCDAQKVRVCRYTVVDTIDNPRAEALVYAGGVPDDELYDDYPEGDDDLDTF